MLNICGIVKLGTVHPSGAHYSYYKSKMVIHQSENLTQELVYGISGDQTFNVTPSGYMDRDSWLKFISHFSTILRATAWNHQFILFEYHGSHNNSNYFDITLSNFIHTFVLKAGDIKNDHPNYNDPNYTLKVVRNGGGRGGGYCRERFETIFYDIYQNSYYRYV